MSVLENLLVEVERLPTRRWRGEIRSAIGLTVEIDGLQNILAVGDKCHGVTSHGDRLLCEIIGFRNDRSLAMAFGNLEGLAAGSAVETDDATFALRPGVGWLGRVVTALGEPIAGRGPLSSGQLARSLRRAPLLFGIQDRAQEGHGGIPTPPSSSAAPMRRISASSHAGPMI